MPIYTKTGDHGKTLNFDQTPTSKTNQRIHAIGTIDELNSSLGVIAALVVEEQHRRLIELVQRDLFQIGGYLSGNQDLLLSTTHIESLEHQIDEWESQLPQLTNFILPGGSYTASLVHQTRSICRRAEREVICFHETQEIHPVILQYVNRLSDWLFMFARYVNLQEGAPEKKWVME